MHPCLEDGQTVLVQQDPAIGSIRIGDILVYRSRRTAERKLIGHRVVGIEPAGIVARGEQAQVADLVPPSDIVGKVVGVYRDPGFTLLEKWSGGEDRWRVPVRLLPRRVAAWGRQLIGRLLPGVPLA